MIFTSGTTDGINLVANILGLSGRISPGDEVLISTLEHHSNIVPWQMLCERTGAVLKVIPCHDDGTLDQDAFLSLLNERTKILALTWISNSFGTVNPVAEMTRAAKNAGALVLIDAAQATAHMRIDVQALGIDFLAFSGHKIYAPTGIGVLWGRAELLNALPPWRGGGEMIKEVTFEKTTYNDLPFKYEAGTPNIEGAIALAAAFDFVNGIGLAAIHEHEQAIIRSAAEALSAIPGHPLLRPRRPRGRAFLQHRGRPPLRSRHADGPNGRRRPHRPPLLPAADGALRHHRHRARLLRALQHASTTSKPSPRPPTKAVSMLR